MTVSELIAALQKYPLDMEVMEFGGENCDYNPILEVCGIVEISEKPHPFWGGYEAVQGSGKKVVVI